MTIEAVQATVLANDDHICLVKPTEHGRQGNGGSCEYAEDVMSTVLRASIPSRTYWKSRRSRGTQLHAAHCHSSVRA